MGWLETLAFLTTSPSSLVGLEKNSISLWPNIYLTDIAKSGWIGEKNSIVLWPNLNLTDISKSGWIGEKQHFIMA